MAVKRGDVVADYKVIDLAGSGGMGTVYKIEHLITKRIEAMKVLPISIGSEPEELQRFEREIQVHARLQHPHIATLYNALRDGRSIALIMEYVEGESLQCVLARGRLPLKIAADYASQVLDALTYAHQKGVIHRDVSPANIIITPEGAAKLTDFGLARAATDLRLTTGGVALGSLWYMSPEQVRAAHQIDARTDIYALGAVLHEMLTGRKLFDADGSFEVMRAQTEIVPPPPSAYNPEIPPALDEIVARALAKDPAARFQTAAEFRLALEYVVTGAQPSTGASSSESASYGGRRRLAVSAASRLFSLRRQFRISRTAAVLALALAAWMAAICTTFLWPRTALVVSKASVPRNTTVESKPAPLMAPVPPSAESAPDPTSMVQVPMGAGEATKLAPRSTALSARPKDKRSLAVRGTGRVAKAPAETAGPAQLPQLTATAPETFDLTPNVEAVPESLPAPAGLNIPAELEAAKQTPEDAKPAQAGNRLVRVLRRLNPFHKSSKNNSVDPAKAEGNNEGVQTKD